MPAGVFVLVEGKVAEVEVPDPELRQQTINRLVMAARPEAWRIDKIVRPTGPVYRAPLDIVIAAGLIDFPAFAEGGITGPVLFKNDGDGERVLSGADAQRFLDAEPPRTGPGSGTEVWREHLRLHQIPFDPDDKRAELIARWDQRGEKP
ncbi:hypothetical protein ACPESR_25175 [Nocardia testacea]|uniref:hypothetical protein n=1 Tax=Nocardia testacea TaxID=248551 RepID=UPI003C2BA12F